jgi:hypothetical protein
MKYIKSYKEEYIIHICEKYGIQNYTINEDGSIDVDGDVYLHDERLTKLPLNFRNVTGSFYCHHNQLTSLKGCPKTVDVNFYCSDNQLTSLECCPVSVGRSFACYHNKLTSLKGCPKTVGDYFNCRYNKIATFEYLPFSIGSFICINNPIYEIWQLFADYSKIEFLNDCDAIREPDGSEEPIIILDRLNYFLEEIGKKPVKKVEGYKCI